uniref:PEP-CTERM protein-sorting domain-containing protein n=1 Tax=Solibacter usitatus (strain Ellin6076) TaxID=234267 RepID=Q01QF6_SOLUE
MTKRLLILLSALSAFALIGSASSLYPACGANTFDYYMQNYATVSSACAVGDKLFFDFSYLPTNSGAIAPTGAQVNIVGDISDPNEPGLVFSSSLWTVSATNPLRNVYIDASISFTVATMDGAALIKDGTLSFAGTESTTGQGHALIGETLILGGGPPSTTLGVDSIGGPFTSITTFSPVSFVTVSKNLQVNVSAGTTGTASIASFREGFSEMPEPVSCVLFGSGLLGLGILRRRRA